MPITNRPTFADFKQKALQNKEVQKEYDALSPLFAIKKQFVASRPNLSTLMKYAEALGMRLDIGLH